MNSQDKELTSVSFHVYGYSPLMCFVKSCNVNEKVETLRGKKKTKKKIELTTDMFIAIDAATEGTRNLHRIK